MNRLISGAALSLLAITAAAAQPAPQPSAPTEFTLTVTKEDLAVIGDALVERPFKVVNPVLQKLNSQLVQQQQPKPKDQEKPPGQGDAPNHPAEPPPVKQ